MSWPHQKWLPATSHKSHASCVCSHFAKPVGNRYWLGAGEQQCLKRKTKGCNVCFCAVSFNYLQSMLRTQRLSSKCDLFQRASLQTLQGCLVQVGNGIELEAVDLQFEPNRWRPFGVTWDSSQTVVVIKLRRTSALLNCNNQFELHQQTPTFAVDHITY